MAEGSYQFFDHTGDFGVDFEAPDMGAALTTFSRALLDLLTGAPDSVAEEEEREVELEGMDPADLLVALGNELIYLFEAEGFLCARFEVEEVGDDYALAWACGESYDAARHPIARPIKAVTHHEAALEPDPAGGVRGRIVFDL